VCGWMEGGGILGVDRTCFMTGTKCEGASFITGTKKSYLNPKFTHPYILVN